MLEDGAILVPANARADAIFDDQSLFERVGIEAGEGPTNDYTGTLVRGVAEHRDRIDEVLTTYSKGWTLSRMPAVDRNVLRLGTFELLYAEDVPDPVAVAEAVQLVRDLSTDESPPFVNGVLGRIQRDKSTLG